MESEYSISMVQRTMSVSLIVNTLMSISERLYPDHLKYREGNGRRTRIEAQGSTTYMRSGGGIGMEYRIHCRFDSGRATGRVWRNTVRVYEFVVLIGSERGL